MFGFGLIKKIFIDGVIRKILIGGLIQMILVGQRLRKIIIDGLIKIIFIINLIMKKKKHARRQPACAVTYCPEQALRGYIYNGLCCALVYCVRCY